MPAMKLTFANTGEVFGDYKKAGFHTETVKAAQVELYSMAEKSWKTAMPSHRNRFESFEFNHKKSNNQEWCRP
jgi:hypothetical protein